MIHRPTPADTGSKGKTMSQIYYSTSGTQVLGNGDLHHVKYESKRANDVGHHRIHKDCVYARTHKMKLDTTLPRFPMAIILGTTKETGDRDANEARWKARRDAREAKRRNDRYTARLVALTGAS